MTAIQTLSDSFDYDPHAHDFTAWFAHHRELVGAMEPARWPMPISERGLTQSEVVGIREAYQTGNHTTRQLASAFGLHVRTIQGILTGMTYKNAGGPIVDSLIDRLLSATDVITIRQRYWSGSATQTGLAREFGVSSPHICLICHGKRYADVSGPTEPPPNGRSA